ncbi:MAG: 2Fe-2S iron-sulfur cluster-binding protein [Cyanobacteria bacterium J06592_8]
MTAIDNLTRSSGGIPHSLQTPDEISIRLKINGTEHTYKIEPWVTLLDLLRENIGLTGTKKGCNHGQCGACTVLVEGRRINSCLALAVQYDGSEITTIEGLATDNELHPVQAAFLNHDGFQCGYCTPGQICSAVALLNELADGEISAVSSQISDLETSVEVTDQEIQERMSGNLCRCGAYVNIVTAIREAHRQGA